MTTKILSKPCRCAVCLEPMAAGEAFAWEKGHRWTVGPKVGGSYTQKRVDAFRPRHVYDCRRAKAEHDFANGAADRERRVLEKIAGLIEHFPQIANNREEAYRQIMEGEIENDRKRLGLFEPWPA